MSRAMPYAAALGALAGLLLASCAIETSLNPKLEPAGVPEITGGILGGAIGTTLDERDRVLIIATAIFMDRVFHTGEDQ